MLIPWYKQFWPWVLITIPSVAVVAGIATLVIALHDPDGLVVSDYYREGLAINQNLARQRAAEALGLSAAFAFDPASGIASVRFSRDDQAQREVNIRLVHPTRAHKDLNGQLLKDMTGKLSGLIGRPGTGRWQVVIEPADGQWRLIGHIELPNQTQARLTPG